MNVEWMEDIGWLDVVEYTDVGWMEAGFMSVLIIITATSAITVTTPTITNAVIPTKVSE